MSLEKRLADTDSIYCTKVTNSNQSSIFISNLGEPKLDILFGAGFKSDDPVRLRLSRRNLALNAVSHVVDNGTWYKRKSTDKWVIDTAWLEQRLAVIKDVFSADENVFVAQLNKDDHSTNRLYMKGMTSLRREDGLKSIALRDFLFSGDVIALTKRENGDVSLEVKVPDCPIADMPQVMSDMPILDVSVLQKITYGAPGTGKSHRTKLETEAWKKNVFRTTFHPDSDYSTFVGAYKPTMSENAGRVEVYKGSGPSKVLDATQEVKQGISYEFVAQAFVKAYVLAWQKMAVASDDESGKPKPEPVFLVIEEINRGNCAQIFGDLFQLLDRNDAGYSEYPVDADADLRKFLGQKKAAAENEAKGLGDIDANALATRYGIETDLAKAIVEGRNLVLPPNLLIRATMNTSDQSLFPIDSAFKRRWDWEYVPISEPEVAQKRKIVCAWDNGGVHVVKRFDWWTFLDQFINKEILETTKSEDKQLGYFFVKAPDETGEITAAKFASKVLFYLYNDVFKDYNYPASVFERKGGNKEKFKFRDFFDAKGKVKDEVVAEFLENLGLVADAPDADRTSDEETPAVHDEE